MMEAREILQQGGLQLGIVLSEKQINELFKYYELLVSWNEKMNLTTIIEEKEVMIKHFLDCLTVAKEFDFTSCTHLIDIGTGAGFPGLPLKIAYPHLEVTLVDSLQKRIGFLEVVVEELGLTNVHCVHGRAEELGQNKQYREKYDCCVSRAVAHLSVLYEYTLPFISLDGYFLALKGPDVTQELADSEKALNQLGGKYEKTGILSLPYSDITHSIVHIRKDRQTPTQYPRKAGTPSKNPMI